MRITPLQFLLLSKVRPPEAVRQATRCSRVTLWRWTYGHTTPRPRDAGQLVDLFDGRLDFNGCYVPSVELTAEQATALGLTGPGA